MTSSAFATLIELCRLWLGSRNGPVRLAPDLDWRELSRQSFCHGLDPLLHHLATRGGIDGEVPALIRARWEETYYKNHVFNTEAIEILGALVAQCAAAGLETLVLKGPVTLARGYRDPGLRIMIDIDLLCRAENLVAVSRIARREGFGSGSRDAVYHVSFRHHEHDLPLEIHFDLYDFLPRREELVDKLLRHASTVEIDGVRLPAAPPEQATILDVAHLVSHDFRVSLKHLLDLAACLCFADPALEPERLRLAAQRVDLGPELRLALQLTQRLFGVGAGFLEVAGADCEADLRRILSDLTQLADRPAREALRQLTYRRGLAAKFDHLHRLLVPPTEQLAAVAEDPGSTRRVRGFLSNLWAAARRGARKMLVGSLARRRDSPDSIKRRVYERHRSRT